MERWYTASQDHGLDIHHCDYLKSGTVTILKVEDSSLVRCDSVSLGRSHHNGSVMGVTHLWSGHMKLLCRRVSSSI